MTSDESPGAGPACVNISETRWQRRWKRRFYAVDIALLAVERGVGRGLTKAGIICRCETHAFSKKTRR